MDTLTPYPVTEEACGTLARKMEEPAIRQQLQEKRERFQRQLDQVDAAIKALDDHPDIEKVLTLVGRTIRL